MTTSTSARLAELRAARVPLVHATVVRAQRPTSASAGDEAIILADGTVEGFVGGHCTHESVRRAALDVLEQDRALLLRVLPAGESAPESEGALVVVNPCLSGGAVEVFLQPELPPRVLHLVGSTPITDALVALAGPLGFALSDSPADGAVAVVVASLGGDEAQAIRAALDAGVGYVGLVASRTRGQALLEGMGLTDAERARVRTPVGLSIGARTPAEIALSVLAEIVAALRTEGLAAPVPSVPVRPREAVDPVCGMTVLVGPDTVHLRLAGEDHWFCHTGCRDRFAAAAGA